MGGDRFRREPWRVLGSFLGDRGAGVAQDLEPGGPHQASIELTFDEAEDLVRAVEDVLRIADELTTYRTPADRRPPVTPRAGRAAGQLRSRTHSTASSGCATSPRAIQGRCEEKRSA